MSYARCSPRRFIGLTIVEGTFPQAWRCSLVPAIKHLPFATRSLFKNDETVTLATVSVVFAKGAVND